jgi:hypothetical protein
VDGLGRSLEFKDADKDTGRGALAWLRTWRPVARLGWFRHGATARRIRSGSYFDRKKASGKTSMEAMRCLKRRLSDLVYKTMLEDLVAAQKTGPGGQPGNDSDSSATGSQPNAGSSDKSLPGPAKTKPKRTFPAAS